MKSRNQQSEISDTWQGLASTTACFFMSHKKTTRHCRGSLKMTVGDPDEERWGIGR